MNAQKWLRAIVSLSVAGAMIVIFGVIAYKLIGAAGIAGVVIVVVGLLINGYIAKVEDNLPDDFRSPRPPAGKGSTKR